MHKVVHNINMSGKQTIEQLKEENQKLKKALKRSEKLNRDLTDIGIIQKSIIPKHLGRIKPDEIKIEKDENKCQVSNNSIMS
jgi:hypothetical protein